MALNALEKAKRLLASRRFSDVISLLEPLVIDYKDFFQFHYLLGTACLYVGDIGGAELYYKRARNLKMTNVDLINAQAVLYLRRGEVNRAVEYYLEVQEYDSNNKLAKKALDFIKRHSNPGIIMHLVQSGKVKRFYPVLGIHPKVVWAISFLSICIVCGMTAFFVLESTVSSNGNRANLSSFVLTDDERADALEQDTASSVFRYILTQKELENAYADAQIYFQQYRDNAAQVEINRILNSNASTAVRQKARLLLEYLTEPGFDTDIEKYTYEQIQSDLQLYLGCWVIWSGRVTNVEITPTEYRCDFLVGYDTLEKVEGFVPLVLQQPVVLDTALPIQILAQVSIEDGRFLLKGKSIYQPILGNN